MAKIISITHGKNRIDCLLSGTLGDKVYCVRKVIQYTRSRPVHTLKSKSAAQLDQSAKFTSTLKFLQPLKGFLRVGFKTEHPTMSPFNAAMSYNFKNALTGTYPHYEIDYSKVRVSQGNLPGALNPAVSLISAGEIKFTWDDNRHAMATNRVLLVLYNSSKQKAEFIVYGNTRFSESQVVTLPETFVGDEVQCYIGFQNYQRSVFSDSQFIGSLIVA